MRRFVALITILTAVPMAAIAQPFAQTATSPLPPAAAQQEDSHGDQASDYLRRAQKALAAGRTRETQEALEMAQTRLLDRSVPLGQTGSPIDDPLVGQVSRALQALAARDRATCMQLIQTATQSATAQGL